MHDLSPPQPSSSAAIWRPLVRFIAAEARLGQWAQQWPTISCLYEFCRFGVKQAWACLFGGAMVALLIATHLSYPPGLPLSRYDFLFVAAIGIQAAMLRFRLETWEEAKVILLFHLVGTLMEIFKTATGSWIYPEPAFFRIAGVPPFSGFMYASIGSYIARAWRLFDFHFTRHPPLWMVFVLGAGIYANFFTDHYGLDFRYVLFAAAALLFGPTRIYYKVWRVHRHMPLLLACFLHALFVWFAENVGTFTRTWAYPHLLADWSLVPFAKLGSWFLLLIISYALVALVNRPRELDERVRIRRFADTPIPGL